MDTIDTLVIGAGHAGLATSHLLTRAGREHVVLDRGRVAESWRTARWDSLRLLTPRWMTRLPGWWYSGPQPEGYMPAAELVGHLDDYARTGAGTVCTGEDVADVRYQRDGYLVTTARRTWRARNVVLATGPGRVRVPSALDGLDPEIPVVTADRYRNPDALPPGGVLVVGASASGSQIADELARAGRRVVLAVGRHTRVPRGYRGMDLFWWLEQTGRLARTIDEVPDPEAARAEPSLQLAGREARDPRGADVDLPSLVDAGVELAGHLVRARGHHVHLAKDLAHTVRTADARLGRLLDSFDELAVRDHLDPELEPAERPRPAPTSPAHSRLDLSREGIGSVVVATGYRPDHPWLRVPVVGRDGHVEQVRGVTRAPGLYVVGQRFQHRRDASFIDGARRCALDVVAHLTCRPGATAALERS